MPIVGEVPAGADALLAIGGLLAVAGDFRTAGGAPHSGIALIDSASGTVLPWHPPATEANEGASVLAASQTILAFNGYPVRPADSISAYRLTPTQP